MNRGTLNTAPKAVRLAIARALVDKAADRLGGPVSGGYREDNTSLRTGGRRKLAFTGNTPAKLGNGSASATRLATVKGCTDGVADRALDRRGIAMTRRPGMGMVEADHAGDRELRISATPSMYDMPRMKPENEPNPANETPAAITTPSAIVATKVRAARIYATAVIGWAKDAASASNGTSGFSACAINRR